MFQKKKTKTVAQHLHWRGYGRSARRLRPDGRFRVPAAQEIIAQDAVTAADAALLARASGPCITAVVSIPNPLEIEAIAHIGAGIGA